MSGIFTKASRPPLAGSYFDWEGEQVATVPPSFGSVVAIPATSDWGPIRTAILYPNFEAYRQVFGDTDTPLHRAVYGAFKGEGRPGHGGAGGVLVFRQGVSGTSAAAVKALNNTTPAVALTLTAKYHGTRANALRITTQASAIAGKTDLIILDGTRVDETYTFANTDITAAAAAINAGSKWFTAVANITGVALALVSASAVAGGNDGAVLTGAEWVQAQDAFDAQRWGVIAAYGLTDPTIRAAFVAWIVARNNIGARALAVIGGAAAEDNATANARSVAINDWDVVNLGQGTLHLDDLAVDASTAEFTARAAGSIANRGESRDLIYARFADVSQAAGVAMPTLAEQATALAAGTTVFCKDTNADAPVFIKEGVTTYANDSQSPVVGGVKTHDVAHYKRIKNLRIQHAIELAADDWFTTGEVAGALPVNDRIRALALGFVKGLYQQREDAEIVQHGWTVVLDQDPPPDDDQDFIQYRHGFHPTRSLRQMFHTARMG
jgi:hypothetical protein